MKKIMTAAVAGSICFGGFMALGAGTANAATTNGDDSILGGTQGILGLNLPVTVSGNAVSVLGDSHSSNSSTTVQQPASGNGAGPVTSGLGSVLGGTQAVVNAVAPVTVSGNAVSVVGDSRSSGATTTVQPSSAGSGQASTAGAHSILGGTQLLGSVQLPVTVSGNAISVVGDSTSKNASTTVRPGLGQGQSMTAGGHSLLGGTQLLGSVSLPITLSGNAISVIGDSTSEDSTTVIGDPVTPGTPGDPGTPGTPGTPGNPGNPGSTATPTSDVFGHVVTTAAVRTSGAGSLAYTGANAAAASAIVAALLAAGTGLLGIRAARRRRDGVKA